MPNNAQRQRDTTDLIDRPDSFSKDTEPWVNAMKARNNATGMRDLAQPRNQKDDIETHGPWLALGYTRNRDE